MIIPNAKEVLRKAWSAHLMIVAALLTGAEAVLPFFTPFKPSPWFALLVFVVVCSALVARFILQQSLRDGK